VDGWTLIRYLHVVALAFFVTSLVIVWLGVVLTH
jgi:hypothetical protein